MSNDVQYALKVAWDETATPGLPTLIGPFESESEALDFIRTSVPNGAAEVLALAYPYQRRRVLDDRSYEIGNEPRR